MAKLTLDGLTKIYGGGLKAVNDVTLTVNEGEFLVLLGPSGCGKSTLLRMIAGLETITAGDLTIDGRTVRGVHPRERDIAMVFQNYALYPHMTVRKNLAYPLKLQKVPKPERDAKVRQVAELLEIEGELDRRPGSLSGGQRQRVAMGRALVREPSVFLMDEPLSNLDARLRAQMRSEIAALQRRLGITTVYVTHDQVEAMTMADRIVVLNEGRVQQIGPPTEVYEHPANLFVAGFIGSPPMNFFAARRTRFGIAVGDREMAVSGDLNTDGGVDAILGVRPEDVRLGEAGADALPIDGTVVAVETLGAETLCHVETGLSGVAVEAGRVAAEGGGGGAFLMRAPGNRADLAGLTVRLRVDVAALRVFDPRTGRAAASTSSGRIPREPTPRP